MKADLKCSNCKNTTVVNVGENVKPVCQKCGSMLEHSKKKYDMIEVNKLELVYKLVPKTKEEEKEEEKDSAPKGKPEDTEPDDPPEDDDNDNEEEEEEVKDLDEIKTELRREIDKCTTKKQLQKVAKKNNVKLGDVKKQGLKDLKGMLFAKIVGKIVNESK